MFIFDYMKSRNTCKLSQNSRKFIIKAYDEGSMIMHEWISNAEVLLVFEEDNEVINEIFHDLNQIEVSMPDFESALKFLKANAHVNYRTCFICRFDYRKPIVFLPEIWHDLVITDLNKRLKKIIRGSGL